MRTFGIVRAACFPLVALAAACSGGGGGDKPDRDVIVGIVNGPVTEAGDQASFTVVLRAKPSADVVIPVTSTDPAEGTVSPGSLTFTRENWDAPQTVLVTGVDDDEKDGNSAFTVSVGPAESTDKVYGGFDPDDVLVTNLDDETAGVIISAVSGVTTELATQATFDVVLQSRPTADVLLIFGTSDLTEGTTDIQSITFTSTNWNSPQVVTITGVDDTAADGAQNYAILFQAAFSEDPEYAFLPVDSVPVTNLDNESAGILVSKTSGVTSELQNQETFTVQLLSKPTATVTLTWTLSDTGEASYSTTTSPTITQQFTINNWNTPQSFIVIGDNDAIADGDQLYTVAVTTVTSQDTAYAAVQKPIINLVNVDDDIPGFIVSAPTGPTAETGDSATFTVSLRAAATSTVTVDLSVTQPNEATVSPASLSLTTAPQTVTVSGKIDFKQDGHKPFAVTFTPAVSTDPAYSGRQIPNVGLTNIDDGPIRTALIFDDANGTHADEAADAAGYEVTVAPDFSTFDAAMDAGDVYFAVLEVTSAMLPASTESRLISYVSSGGLLILSHWDLASHPVLQSALEVTATTTPSNNRLVFPANGVSPNLFAGSNPFAAPLVGDALAGDVASELLVTNTNGKLACLFDDPAPGTGTGAVAITRDSTVIVNGFSPDDYVATDADVPAPDGQPDVRELYRNEIEAFESGGALTSPQRFDNNTPLATVDNGTIQSTISVSNIPAPITNVTLSLHITHEFLSALDIFLIHPDGTQVELVTDESGTSYGAGCTPDASRTTFDDAAATLITSGSGTHEGSFRPEQAGGMAVLDGKPADGLWTLRVTDDDAFGDIGMLNCWSLIIEF